MGAANLLLLAWGLLFRSSGGITEFNLFIDRMLRMSVTSKAKRLSLGNLVKTTRFPDIELSVFL